MSDAIRNTTGIIYEVRSPANRYYSASGTAVDYVVGVLRVPIAFVIELDGESFERSEYYIRRTGKGISMALLKMIDLLKLKNIL